MRKMSLQLLVGSTTMLNGMSGFSTDAAIVAISAPIGFDGNSPIIGIFKATFISNFQLGCLTCEGQQ